MKRHQSDSGSETGVISFFLTMKSFHVQHKHAAGFLRMNNSVAYIFTFFFFWPLHLTFASS